MRLGGDAEGLDVLDRAEEVGALQEDGGGLPVDRAGERRGVGQPTHKPDLDQLGAEPRRIGGQGLAAVGVNAAGDDEAAASGRPDRQVGGRGDRGGPLIETGARDRQPGQL